MHSGFAVGFFRLGLGLGRINLSRIGLKNFSCVSLTLQAATDVDPSRIAFRHPSSDFLHCLHTCCCCRSAFLAFFFAFGVTFGLPPRTSVMTCLRLSLLAFLVLVCSLPALVLLPPLPPLLPLPLSLSFSIEQRSLAEVEAL